MAERRVDHEGGTVLASSLPGHATEAGATDARLQMTQAQRAAWAAQLAAPGDWTHNVARFLEVKGPVDVGALAQAGRQAMLDMPTLRLRVTQDEVAPELVLDPTGPEVPVVDVRTARNPRETAMRLMRSELEAAGADGRTPLAAVVYRVEDGVTLFYQRCHHLLLDGYGASLLAYRLSEVYPALAEGSPVPAHAFAGLDVLHREDEAYRQGPDRLRDREFWARRCEGLVPPEDLLPAPRQPGVLRVTAHGPVGLGSAVRELSRRLRQPWPVLQAAAAAAWLHRRTGASEVVLGWTVSGRTTPVLRQVPCTQSDVLPVRLRVAGLDGASLVARTGAALREVSRHQRYRSTDLRHDLGLAPGARLHGPEVNVMPFTRTTAFGAHPAVVHNLLHGAVDELALTGYPPEESEGPRFDVDVRVGSLGEGDLEDLGAEFLTVLRGLVTEPHRPVASIRRIADNTAGRLRTWGRGPDRASAAGRGVAEVVRRHGADHPERPAVVDGTGADTRTMNYGDLVRTAGLTAELLGDAPGPVVAVLAERSAVQVCSLLAVLGSGSAFIALDTRWPDERIRALLSEHGVTTLVASPGQDGRARSLGVDGLGVVVAPDGHARVAGSWQWVAPPTGQAAAYVVATSGSTGRPKVAVVTHDGFENHLRAKVEAFGIGPGDVVAQNAPSSFDVLVWQVFAPLLAGACVRVVPDGVAADPERLFDLVAADGVDLLEVVPSLLGAALDHWDLDGRPAAGASRLRTLVVTGEDLPALLVRRWARHVPSVAVVNAYGPAECSDDVTHAVVTTDADPVRAPIGRPLPGMHLLVLDAHLQQVPLNQPGELYVAGVGVGRGYLGAPGRTAASFVADVTGEHPGARMYRTGDRVRFRPDGCLEFLGRQDFQVKVRGQRIELEEVEAAMRAVPRVRDAAVVITDGPAPRLAGLVVGAVDPEVVRRILAETLTEAMVPTSVSSVPALPRTANGKLDRRALRCLLKADEPVLDLRSGAPGADGTEVVLRQLVAEVLGLDPAQVDADRNFVDQGGDSLLALRLVSRARAAGLVLRLPDVWAAGSLRALAALAVNTAALPATLHDSGTRAMAWPPAASDLRAAGAVPDDYGQVLVLCAPADLRRDHLVDALQDLLEHHVALRLSVVGDRLAVLAHGTVDAGACVEEVVADGQDAVVAAAEAARRTAVSRLRPGQGQMLAATFVRNSDGDAAGRLVLALHHLAVDAASWPVLVGDLRSAWSARRDDRDPRLPAVPVAYTTWAEDVHRRSGDRVHELSHWVGVTRPRPAWAAGAADAGRAGTGPARSAVVELSAEVTARLLTRTTAVFRARVEDVLLAATALVVLERWPEPEGLVVELEGHGRDDTAVGDLARTVGWLTAAFPVLVDPGPADGFWEAGRAAGDVLKRVKEQRRAVPGGGTGFAVLRHGLDATARARLAAAVRPSVGLNYLGRLMWGDGVGDWSVVSTSDLVDAHEGTRAPRHGLDVTSALVGHGPETRLQTTWVWPDDIPGAPDMPSLVRRWADAVGVFVEHSIRPGAGGPTPSDVAADITQDELDHLVADLAITEAGL